MTATPVSSASGSQPQPDPTASAPHDAGSARSARLMALTEPGPLHVRWGLVVLVSLVIAGVGTLLLGGAPTYDPWAWIIWGREIIQGDLVTTTGPSWKPLPMFFTVPFALFGDAAPDLWMWVARATALIGIVAVADLAARIGGRLAAGLAGLAIGLAPLYYAYGIQGSSEGMLVLVCCLAATAWIDGRRNVAFWWLVAAALLRPEAWPFVALVGLERLKVRPANIWWLAGAAVLVLVTWLVPEKIGGGAYLRAATRAHAPNPDSAAFASSPALEVLGSMGNLMLWLPAIGVALTIVVGAVAWRRSEPDAPAESSDGSASTPAASGFPSRGTLQIAFALLALAFGWVAIVAAMTEGGYAGNPRYLAAPLGFLVAVGLGGLAWLVRIAAARGLAVVGELLVMGALLALVIVAGLRLPGRTDEIRYQSANRVQLDDIASDPGIKAKILACQPIHTHPLMVPPVAWTLGLHVDQVKSNRPLRGGTYIIGTNVPSKARRPMLPPGLPVTTIATRSQVTVVQDCTPR
ncbi:MAG: hypothetical protein JHD16_05155 [Solirubrobacteraceae bacterium]|nr:hypothetical protein [Solirubrobacteraceae bacterium]